MAAPKKKTTKARPKPKQTTKTQTHRSFRLSRKKTMPSPVSQLPTTRRLLLDTIGLLWQGKWPIAKLLAIHLALLLLLALDPFSSVSQLYVSILLVIMSMAEIWLVRQLQSDGPTQIKPALYQGTSQVVPFALTGLLLVLQMLPVVIGLWLFQIVVVQEIVVRFSEQAIFFVLLGGLALLSWYWMSVSLFAIYIATLPDLTPMQAWHTAKPLVEDRRIRVFWRVAVMLMIVLLLGYGLVLLIPTAWLSNYNILPLIVAVLLPVWHIYMYKLYRSLV